MIKLAVEELLRYNGPLETATERYTREDTTVAGVIVPRGGRFNISDNRLFDPLQPPAATFNANDSIERAQRTSPNFTLL